MASKNMVDENSASIPTFLRELEENIIERVIDEDETMEMETDKTALINETQEVMETDKTALIINQYYHLYYHTFCGELYNTSNVINTSVGRFRTGRKAHI